ncbi:MAG: nucleoside 2-deoxyribosyltransferase [Candidatus Paceibacterota bacterium]|jgi:nucleoside 2-deoxyribosyltransferase
MNQVTLYLAGGLFNAAEQIHNLYLEKYLEELGYHVILPQREALKFKNDDYFDIPGIVDDCAKCAISPLYIYVGCIDGTGADDGTCVEYGMAIAIKGEAIVYRTDIRTAIDREVGVNAMLRAKGTKLVLYPCFLTELEQIDDFYKSLSQKIHEAVRSLNNV